MGRKNCHLILMLSLLLAFPCWVSAANQPPPEGGVLPNFRTAGSRGTSLPTVPRTGSKVRFLDPGYQSRGGHHRDFQHVLTALSAGGSHCQQDVSPAGRRSQVQGKSQADRHRRRQFGFRDRLFQENLRHPFPIVFRRRFCHPQAFGRGQNTVFYRHPDHAGRLSPDFLFEARRSHGCG